MKDKQMIMQIIQGFNIEKYIKNINKNEIVMDVEDFELIKKKLNLILKSLNNLSENDELYLIDFELISKYLNNIENKNYKTEFYNLINKYSDCINGLTLLNLKDLIYSLDLFNNELFLIDEKFKDYSIIIENIIKYLKSLYLTEVIDNDININIIKQGKNPPELNLISETIKNETNKFNTKFSQILNDLKIERVNSNHDQIRSIDTKIKIINAMLKLNRNNIELTFLNVFKNSEVSSTSVRKYMKLYLQ